MKKSILFGFFATALLTTFQVSAQSDAQRKLIADKTDVLANQEAMQELQQINVERKQRVLNYAQTHDVEIRSYDSEGNTIILTDVDDSGNPIYTKTLNLPGVRTMGAHQLYPGGTLGLDVTGDGIEAGIWDGGYVRDSHEALIGRITLKETAATGLSGHATHVGGTMIASIAGGLTRRGVAYEGTLLSFDFADDTVEMLPEAVAGMIVSNHSYGLDLSSVSSARNFVGVYSQNSRLFDLITSRNEFYLPMVSAGNDRNAGLNTADGGYDLLTGTAVSKNVITVGAVNSTLNYTGPSSVVMSNFSSWGPTDDGRIKPDIVATGVAVQSSEANTDTSYGTRQGTSMSSPMVSGGMMLLHELYGQLNPNSLMKAATAKGLVLITAKEAGSFDGPDYRFGWGLIDIQAAAQMLLSADNTSLIDERTLTNNTTYTRTVTSNQNLLKVGIVWTDPQGSSNSGAPEDDTTPALINNLDIKLTDANGVDYFPWKLDVNNFTSRATKGLNDVDNVEIVEIQAPAGTYTITVNHRGSLSGGAEDFTLFITGADTGTLSNNTEVLETIKIYPNPAQTFFNVAMDGQLNGSKINVSVYDTLGKQVINNSYSNAATFQQRVDVSALNSGIYIVKVSDGSASTSKKLVIR